MIQGAHVRRAGVDSPPPLQQAAVPAWQWPASTTSSGIDGVVEPSIFKNGLRAFARH